MRKLGQSDLDFCLRVISSCSTIDHKKSLVSWMDNLISKREFDCLYIKLRFMLVLDKCKSYTESLNV